MTRPAASPPDLSSLPGADFDEIRPLLDKLADAPDERSDLAFVALLLDRALDLLRRGSRDEIGDEALNVHLFLDGDAGERLRQARPETFGGFRAIGRLLSEAARRSDPAAVDSILRATRGRGQELLEALAERGEAVARSELKKKLGLSESHLSHLLRELDEAELVVRYRPDGGREVVVELGPVGREVVERSVMPSWIEYLVARLEEARGSAARSFDEEALERELLEHGAPSKLVASRLAAALAPLMKLEARVPPGAWPGALPYIDGVMASEGGDHFERLLDLQGQRPPRALFAGTAPNA